MTKNKTIILSLNDFIIDNKYNLKRYYNKTNNIEIYCINDNQFKIYSHYKLEIAKSLLQRYMHSDAKIENRRERYIVSNKLKSLKVLKA